MATARPQISRAELETLVLEAVAAEGRPVTVAEIHRAIPKALRPASKALTPIVSALAEARRIFRVGRRWGTQPDRALHERILRASSAEARTAAELAKELRAPVSRVREAIRALVAAGELHAHPKHRYGAQPPTAADRLRPELARLLAAAKKLGIPEAEAKNALRELLGGTAAAAGNEPIVTALRELNPDGALVYLPHLRTAVASSFPDKPSFDRAVLGLLARGTIQLQSHPTPSLLGAAERDALIEDGRGGYFTAIGLR